jgi:NAD(P)-dependent dehydrogenase (short-subunit alcohol dehydrogenase family)
VLGPVSPLGHVDPKAWDEILAINVTANWRLIRAMDVLLRLSDAGRAVFLASTAASVAKAYRGPYSMSKAALEVLIRTYAAETITTPVRVNLFNPGATRTRMRAQLMPGEDPMTLPTADTIAGKILELCLPDFQETGKIFDYPQGRLLTPQPPA